MNYDCNQDHRLAAGYLFFLFDIKSVYFISRWTNIGVDESLLSHLTPLGPTNPLSGFNLGQFGSSTTLMQQEELMQQAREEHRLKMEVLRLQKRAWQIKVDQLSRYAPSTESNGEAKLRVSAGDGMM